MEEDCLICGRRFQSDLCSNCDSRLVYCPDHSLYHKVGPGDASCGPLVVSDVPGAGRGLTAARDVERGELILSVSPLATGPLYNPHSKRSLQCVQCYKHLQKPHHCQRCRLPVCSSSCSR